MKTPLSWISLYSPLNTLLEKHSLKSLAHTYSIHTAEIEAFEEHFIDLVVVGKVLSCEKHPESKKLSIVEVLIGPNQTTTILTGAPNIVDATYVPVALVGCTLPGNFVIGERMMAGMMSRGMICGLDELGLTKEVQSGIMILEEIWEKAYLESMIGKLFFDLQTSFVGRDGNSFLYSLKDATFEIDNKFITNRPDLFSIHGNAREWQAVFGTTFTPYTPRNIPLPGGLPLSIETPFCSAYNAWKMENITVNKSPWGMSLMMEHAGLTPKMDIVDITNCIMTELGQPMHAFDADKITGGITVRMAKKGESLLALNNQTYELTEDDMVIADDQGPIALAGVIGGMESAVSESTRTIIWESATFDPICVRLTAQRHGIRTDASTRYEKSLDPLLSSITLSRVIDYMTFLKKEVTISSSATYLDSQSVKDISISVTDSFLTDKIGVSIKTEEIDTILKNLGFEFVWNNDVRIIQVPSWRATKDISIKEDIAEEIGRIYGYDKVPLISLNGKSDILYKNEESELKNEILSYFAHIGWNEVYNYSFTNEDLEKKIGYSLDDDAISIKNSFNESYTHMRRSLSPLLFENIRENQRHDSKISLFEIGKTYRKYGSHNDQISLLLKKQLSEPYYEKKMLAGAMIGFDIPYLRKNLEGLMMQLFGFVPPIHQDVMTHAFLHPGISGCYRIGDDAIIQFGQIHPGVSDAFDIPSETLYFEADFELLLKYKNEREYRFHEISRFQTIRRELNFVVPEKTLTGSMGQSLSAIHPWITNISVDSIYRDEARLGSGKKSVNFSFELMSLEDTISDSDAQKVQDMIIARMGELGYTLRSIGN